MKIKMKTMRSTIQDYMTNIILKNIRINIMKMSTIPNMKKISIT